MSVSENKKNKLLSQQNFKVFLKYDTNNPYTAEDKAAWERMAETAFCLMAQSQEYNGFTHETLLNEAGLVADTFLNMSRQRFCENTQNVRSNSFDDVPDTGVYRIHTGLKA